MKDVNNMSGILKHDRSDNAHNLWTLHILSMYLTICAMFRPSGEPPHGRVTGGHGGSRGYHAPSPNVTLPAASWTPGGVKLGGGLD